MATMFRFYRLLVSSLLVSAVLAFTTPHPRNLGRTLKHQIPPKPIFYESPTTLHIRDIKTGDAGSLFGEKNSKRIFSLSLRQFFRKAIRFATQNKRRKLAALVFAASVWLRGPHQEMMIARAAPVEQVTPDPSLEDSSSSTMTISNQQKGMNKKVATALTGVVVLPSAGLAVVRGQKNKEATDGKEGFPDKTDENSSEANSEAPSETEKNDLVKNVLDKAKKARLRVDADSYLKSLEREKSVITSAISKLKSTVYKEEKPVASTGPEADSEAADPMASDENGDKVARGVVLEEDVPTNSNLPLMTAQFVKARQQPKPAKEEQMLRQKYQPIPNVSDRAFNILVDLGMIETDDQSIVIGLPVEEEEPFQ